MLFEIDCLTIHVSFIFHHFPPSIHWLYIFSAQNFLLIKLNGIEGEALIASEAGV